MKTKILALLSTLLLLPLAARADLHAGDYQFLEDGPGGLNSTDVKISQDKDGDFTIIFPASVWSYNGIVGPNEMKITVSKDVISFESIIHGDRAVGYRFYVAEKTNNPDVYQGAMTGGEVGARPGNMQGGDWSNFKLIPKK